MKTHNIRTLIAACITLATVAGGGTARAENSEADAWSGKVSLGYRAFDTQENFRRAIEYTRAESGATAGLEVKASRGHRHFHLETEYLNDSEYRANIGFDYGGLIRLDLFGESLYHNLDHIPYDPVNRPVPSSTVTFSDANPGDNYHVEVHQSGARLRAKHPGVPAHINLAYWRLDREGSKQLRFADEGNGTGGTNCRSCHATSRTQKVDRVTEEVTGGFDAHLGPIDIIFEQLFRKFRDRESIPVDTFGSHRYRTGPADLQHDESPDSRLTESTLKLRTSNDGGLAGAVTLGIGEMKNLSDLADVRPVKAETDFRKAAGDVTYTPGERWTFNFRYRFLDLDSSNSDRITADALVLSSADGLDVRDSIDLTRAQYEAIAAYRPTRKLTLKGEFRRTEIDRSDTGENVVFSINTTTVPATAIIDPVWELPAEENIHRFRLSAAARPLERNSLKLNGWYEYETSDDPAYGTSVEKAHRVFAGAAWTPSSRWGVLANGRYGLEDNNDHTFHLVDQGGVFSEFRQEREKESVQAVSSLWLLPADALSFSLNYGFFYTRITQDVLFGKQVNTVNPSLNYAIVADDTEYVQRVHTVSCAAAWRILENLQSRLETRYIRSTALFSPEFFASGLSFLSGALVTDVDSSLLKEISEVDIRQTGIQIGLDWSPAPQWTISTAFSYDDYDDRDADIFDGAAQSYTVQLARTW